jgi:ribosomal protein S18 acetylase RimI-like enzyme
MTIKKLNVNDTNQIAELHIKSFRSFFLTSLGKRFLKIFYKSIINHGNGIAIGIFDGDELMAFAVGTQVKSGFYSDLIKRNFLRMSLAAFPSLLGNPSKGVKLIRSILVQDTTETEILNSASLLSICVDPARGGGGIGKNILCAFEDAAFAKSNIISLTTDAIDNDYVNSFYKKNNYKLANTFNKGERIMNLYTKNSNI